MRSELASNRRPKAARHTPAMAAVVILMCVVACRGQADKAAQAIAVEHPNGWVTPPPPIDARIAGADVDAEVDAAWVPVDLATVTHCVTFADGTERAFLCEEGREACEEGRRRVVIADAFLAVGECYEAYGTPVPTPGATAWRDLPLKPIPIGERDFVLGVGCRRGCPCGGTCIDCKKTCRAPGEGSGGGGGCVKGCRCGNSCIACWKTCHGGTAYRKRRR